MSEYGDYIQKAIVIGLERFIGLQWKVVECDSPGCDLHFGVGFRHGDAVRAAAELQGWRCGEDGDYCPKHDNTSTRGN